MNRVKTGTDSFARIRLGALNFTSFIGKSMLFGLSKDWYEWPKFHMSPFNIFAFYLLFNALLPLFSSRAHCHRFLYECVCVSFLFAVLSVVPPQSWTFLCNYYFTFAPMTQAICLYSLNALRSPVQCIQAVLFQFHAVIRI